MQVCLLNSVCLAENYIKKGTKALWFNLNALDLHNKDPQELHAQVTV